VPKKKLVRLTHTHTNIETILKYLLQLTALAHVDKKCSLRGLIYFKPSFQVY